MDEKQISELLECSVCLEQLDQSCKVLPCQHTFCRRCLDEILLTKQELRCPECRALVTIKVADLPTNILVMRILEGLKTQGYKASIALGNDGGGGQLQVAGSSPTRQTGLSPHKSRSDARGLQSAQHFRQGHSFAKALYDYESTEKDDLSFRKGDIIQLRRQIDENWYQGELSGKMGCFPANFVKTIIPLPQVPQSRALYDFDLKDENEKDCLIFQKDEILTVIRRVDDNWLEGRKGDKIGIFPLTFVVLNDAARILINSKASTKISSSTPAAPSVPVSIPSCSSASMTTAVFTGSVLSTTALTPTSTSSSSFTSPFSVPLENGPVAAPRESSTHTATTLSSSSSPSPAVQSGSSFDVPIVTDAAAVIGSSPTNTTQQLLNDTTQTKRHSYSSSPSRFSPVPGVHSPSQQRHSLEVIVSIEGSQDLPNAPSLPPPSSSAAASSSSSSSSHTAPSIDNTTAVGTNSASSSVLASAENSDTVALLSSSQQSSSPSNVQQEEREENSPSGNGGQPESAQSAALSNPLYVAIYNYLPQKEDELELQKGDQYLVFEKCQDGWFKGSCMKTGGSGMFPGNYVSILRHSSAFKPVNPNVLNIRAKVPTSPAVSSSPLPTNPTTSNSPHQSATVVASVGNTGGNGSGTSSPNQNGPPLLPRVPKLNSSGQKQRQPSVPPMRSLSSPASSAGPPLTKHQMLETAVETSSSSLSSRGQSGSGGSSSHATSASSPSHRSMWSSMAPSLPQRPATQAPTVGMATSHDSAQSLFGTGKEKDKKKKKEKEKRGLLKLLKDKKSKQSSTNSESTTSPHVRGGSHPSEISASPGRGSGDSILMVQHRKASSLDSSSGPPPPVPAKPTRPRPLPRERYCCIVPYPPQTDYELSLELGDIIHVHRKREDGWYKGTQERTGKTGMFPASFVDKCI